VARLAPRCTAIALHDRRPARMRWQPLQRPSLYL